eukprot:5136028-Prorocentrum_lima.AAC.1
MRISGRCLCEGGPHDAPLPHRSSAPRRFSADVCSATPNTLAISVCDLVCWEQNSWIAPP